MYVHLRRHSSVYLFNYNHHNLCKMIQLDLKAYQSKVNCLCVRIIHIIYEEMKYYLFLFFTYRFIIIMSFLLAL